MLSQLRFICIVLCFFTCIDIVYGKKIDKLEDLLDEDVLLKDKVGYLSYIKYDYPFSTEDIDILMRVFENNETFDFEYELGSTDKQKKYSSSEDIGRKDKIRGIILEILLKDRVDEKILKFSQMTWIAFKAIGEIDSSDLDIGYKTNRYLALRVLIKINELRPNTDDNISKGIRDFIYDNLENSIQNNPDELVTELDTLLREVYSNDRDRIVELKSLLNLTKPEKMSKRIKRNRSFYARGNIWQHRSTVEDHIFDPILLELGGDYIEKDREVLYSYEKYLLEHIKFFPTTDNLKQLVEKAFFKTRFLEFRPQYINTMFYLDMEDTLIKIILDTSIDMTLRKQAIKVSIDLLREINILAFKKFSKTFLESMRVVSSSAEETTELKEEAKEKIELVQSMIDKHDEMNDLESIVFSSNISGEEKLEYLNEIFSQGFLFFKKDLGFIKRVLDDENIDVRVKAIISFIGLYNNKPKDVFRVFTRDDVEAMVFLFVNVIQSNNDSRYSDMTEVVAKRWKKAIDLLEDNGAGTLDLYYRFDMWEKLIDYLNSEKENPTMKVLAIQTSLDLLSKTRSFQEFREVFLDTLQNISKDKNGDSGLKNVSEFVLQLVKSGRVSLKEGSCIFKFGL